MNNLKKIIREFIFNKINESYQGEHEAPHREDGYTSPIYDMTSAYGEDIYTPNAYKFFGQDDPLYAQGINIIQSLRNKPKASVKIYRAIPNFNYDIEEKEKQYHNLLNYYNRFGFFPMKNKMPKEYEILTKIETDLLNKKDYVNLDYDTKQKAIIDEIQNKIDELKVQKLNTKTSINDGDWITTVKQYAIEHGKDNLKNKYKILSKTVRANQIYGNGDSPLEFGYSD